MATVAALPESLKLKFFIGTGEQRSVFHTKLGQPFTFERIGNKVCKKIPQAGDPSKLVLKWVDNDGDAISMDTDGELAEAVAAAPLDPKTRVATLMLEVYSKSDAASAPVLVQPMTSFDSLVSRKMLKAQVRAFKEAAKASGNKGLSAAAPQSACASSPAMTPADIEEILRRVIPEILAANSPHLEAPAVSSTTETSSVPVSSGNTGGADHPATDDTANHVNLADIPYPDGWEVRMTEGGTLYYVDHNTRSTTWTDPRISISQEMDRQSSLAARDSGQPTQPGMHQSSEQTNEDAEEINYEHVTRNEYTTALQAQRKAEEHAADLQQVQRHLEAEIVSLNAKIADMKCTHDSIVATLKADMDNLQNIHADELLERRARESELASALACRDQQLADTLDTVKALNEELHKCKSNAEVVTDERDVLEAEGRGSQNRVPAPVSHQADVRTIFASLDASSSSEGNVDPGSEKDQRSKKCKSKRGCYVELARTIGAASKISEKPTDVSMTATESNDCREETAPLIDLESPQPRVISPPPLSTAVEPCSDSSASRVTPKYAAKFVEDVTLPDNSAVYRSEKIVKVWKVRNSGSETWPDSTVIVHTDGTLSGLKFTAPVSPVAPGETTEISVTFDATALPSGRHASLYKLDSTDTSKQFEDFFLWCAIDIVDDDVSPAPIMDSTLHIDAEAMRLTRSHCRSLSGNPSIQSEDPSSVDDFVPIQIAEAIGDGSHETHDSIGGDGVMVELSSTASIASEPIDIDVGAAVTEKDDSESPSAPSDDGPVCPDTDKPVDSVVSNLFGYVFGKNDVPAPEAGKDSAQPCLDDCRADSGGLPESSTDRTSFSASNSSELITITNDDVRDEVVPVCEGKARHVQPTVDSSRGTPASIVESNEEFITEPDEAVAAVLSEIQSDGEALCTPVSNAVSRGDNAEHEVSWIRFVESHPGALETIENMIAMGFGSRERNQRALIKHKGRAIDAVDELLNENQ